MNHCRKIKKQLAPLSANNSKVTFDEVSKQIALKWITFKYKTYKLHILLQIEECHILSKLSNDNTVIKKNKGPSIKHFRKNSRKS